MLERQAKRGYVGTLVIGFWPNPCIHAADGLATVLKLVPSVAIFLIIISRALS